MRRDGPEEGASQQCRGGEAPRRRLVLRLAELSLYTLGPPGGIGGLESSVFARSVAGFCVYFLPVPLGENSLLERWQDPDA